MASVLDTTLCDKVCQCQVCGFLQVLQFPPPIKLTITMLKVALNTITPRFVQMKVPGAFDESPWGQELKILKFI
jgi:hypothetical protein